MNPSNLSVIRTIDPVLHALVAPRPNSGPAKCRAKLQGFQETLQRPSLRITQSPILLSGSMNRGSLSGEAMVHRGCSSKVRAEMFHEMFDDLPKRGYFFLTRRRIWSYRYSIRSIPSGESSKTVRVVSGNMRGRAGSRSAALMNFPLASGEDCEEIYDTSLQGRSSTICDGFMTIQIFLDENSASASAEAGAHEMHRLAGLNLGLAVIFFTRASQVAMLQSLPSIPALPWNGLCGFDFDEDVGLDENRPASLRRNLRERLTSRVPMRQFCAIDDPNPPPRPHTDRLRVGNLRRASGSTHSQRLSTILRNRHHYS